MLDKIAAKTKWTNRCNRCHRWGRSFPKFPDLADSPVYPDYNIQKRNVPGKNKAAKVVRARGLEPPQG